MITTKLYEGENSELVAAVYTDDLCTNIVFDPELVAFDADSFIEDARFGFEDALDYDEDISESKRSVDIAEELENGGNLVAIIGDEVILFPGRMSESTQELFQLELGELWDDIVDSDDTDDGVKVDI